MNGDSLIGKIYAWVWHPSNSNETMKEWFAFLVLIILASFLWARTVNNL